MTEQWGQVLFLDESTFELIPGRRTFTWRRKGVQTVLHMSTVKHGGGKIQVMYPLHL